MKHDPDLERFEDEAPHTAPPHTEPAMEGWPTGYEMPWDNLKPPTSLPLGPDGKDGVLVR